MENADEHFSLKWSNFRSSITEGFHDFLQEERMVDVTLAAEGKFLQAHKLVLSVCSPYFKNLFNVNPCKHPIVIFKDVGHNELSYMLEFMYRGEVGVKHEELPSFLKLAESLKIKGLDGDKLENEEYDPLSKTRSTITRIRKKKLLSDTGTDKSESESNSGRQRDDRLSRQRKRRFTSNPKSDHNTKTSYSKKMKQDREKKSLNNKNNTRDSFDNDDENPLIKLISNKTVNDENSKPGDSRDSNIDNGLDGDDDDDDDDDTGTQSDDFDIPPSLYTGDNAADAEQIPQGGVDYQMIQTKRGRDMLLYDGFTFTQNRMCKDGMRWQCSFPKCKAFCRMSSAGWLTPYKTNHEHPRPSEEEIKRRILRMELKARAQSSGATPGEIIRNALPADEYQTSDQRACYTRCIQRFRKSLQRKNTKPPDDGWSGHNSDAQQKEIMDNKPPAQQNAEETTPWMAVNPPKPLLPPLPLPMKDDGKHHPMWQNHPEPVQLPPEREKQQGHCVEPKGDIHTKIGPYGM